MHFTVPKKELAAALTRCAAVAEAKGSLPILSNVWIKPLYQSLAVNATDLEVGFGTFVEGLIWDESIDFGPEHEVPFLLDAVRIRDCIKAIPIDEVDFEVTGDLVVTVSGGTVSFTLHALPAEDFPRQVETEGGSFMIDARALVDGLKNVAYAQCKDATRFNLCGVRFLVEECTDGDFVTTVTTDGHRLAISSIAAVEDDECTRTGAVPAPLLAGVTIPTKGVTEICKIASREKVCLTVNPSSIIVTTGEGILTIRLIDGDYPDFNRVIPAMPPHSVRVKRQGLIDALERCRIMTNKNSKGISLRIQGDRLTLSSSIEEIGGEAFDYLTAEVIGNPEDIKMDCGYLIQALEGLAGADAELHITDSLAPIIVQSAGSDSLQGIVMGTR